MTSTPNSEAFSRLVTVVDARGVRAGIEYLNSLTAHRFTALYRFDRETLRNLYFFDRENPALESSDAIPVVSSYCVYVRDTGSPFKTDDSRCDPRVSGHPKQLTIQAYCGVPLVDRDGRMFGTVCHFDVKPVATDPSHVELLERVADLLRYRLPHAS